MSNRDTASRASSPSNIIKVSAEFWNQILRMIVRIVRIKLFIDQSCIHFLLDNRNRTQKWDESPC